MDEMDEIDEINQNDNLDSYKNRKIKERYDQSASSYNTRYRIPQYIKYSIILKVLLNDFDKSSIIFNQDAPILDLGGGTGLFNNFFRGFQALLKFYCEYFCKPLPKFPNLEVLEAFEKSVKIETSDKFETFDKFTEEILNYACDSNRMNRPGEIRVSNRALTANSNPDRLIGFLNEVSHSEILIFLFLFFFIIGGLSKKDLLLMCKSEQRVNGSNSLREDTDHMVTSDISFEMLKNNKKGFKGEIGKINVLCDAEALPFRDHSMFAVFTFTALQNFGVPSTAIAEIIRILDKDGFLIGSSLKKENTLSFFNLERIIKSCIQFAASKSINDHTIVHIEMEKHRKEFYALKRQFEKVGYFISNDINAYINSIEDFFFYYQ